MNIDELFAYALYGTTVASQIADSMARLPSLTTSVDPDDGEAASDFINKSEVSKVLDVLFAPLEREASLINPEWRNKPDETDCSQTAMIGDLDVRVADSDFQSLSLADQPVADQGGVINFKALTEEMASIRTLLSSEWKADEVKNLHLALDPVAIPLGTPVEDSLPAAGEIQPPSSPEPVTMKKIQLGSKPPKSSVKKRAKEEVGRMESLARELLALVDEPCDELGATSAKRSRETPEALRSLIPNKVHMDQPVVVDQQEVDLVEVKERKRSLLQDFDLAASRDQSLSQSSAVLILSRTQVVEEILPSVPKASSSSQKTPLGLGYLSTLDFSRAWAPSQTQPSPAHLKSLPLASARESRSQLQSSKGRYPSMSSNSKHLDTILSCLTSPKRFS